MKIEVDRHKLQPLNQLIEDRIFLAHWLSSHLFVVKLERGGGKRARVFIIRPSPITKKFKLSETDLQNCQFYGNLFYTTFYQFLFFIHL